MAKKSIFSNIENKLLVPPALKVKETPTQLIFKYTGFNYSYGGEKGLETYGLEITFYR